MCRKGYLWAGHLLVDGCVYVLQRQLRHRCSAVVCSCCAGFRSCLPKVSLEARAPFLLPSHTPFSKPDYPYHAGDANIISVERRQLGTYCQRHIGEGHPCEPLQSTALVQGGFQDSSYSLCNHYRTLYPSCVCMQYLRRVMWLGLSQVT